MAGRSIYQISESMQEVRRIIESEDDWSDYDKDVALNAYFESCGEEIESKGDSYAAVIIEKKSQAEMFKAEAKRLTEMARREEAEIDRMKARLEWFIRQNGWTSMPSRLHKIRLVTNGGKLPVILNPEFEAEPSLLPAWAQRITIQPDRQAIADGLEHESEDWRRMASEIAHFGDRGQSLRID